MTGRNRVAAACEQYYKLTGLLDLPSGYVRAFFQANDINPSGLSAFTDYQGGSISTCDDLGAGNQTNQFIFSGLFYADLTNTLYVSPVYKGDNYSQLYPAPRSQPVRRMRV